MASRFCRIQPAATRAASMSRRAFCSGVGFIGDHPRPGSIFAADPWRWCRSRAPARDRSDGPAACAWPGPCFRLARIACSVASTTVGPTGTVGMVTRKRVTISSKVGGGRSASRQTDVIRWMPLPHCSISPSAWKTRPMTRLRSLDTPCGRSSTVSPKGSRPGFSISSRSSKIDSRIGAPRWE